ncbi:unnamed protein product [Arabis nemorensis]|uniref:Uncharacterized protein n=1 Tax=Arabis nemorensis TaxID=586526 RepID=A0A565BE68_9BRAS|nr:unnamed protein product [Arabis nemorensis]
MEIRDRVSARLVPDTQARCCCLLVQPRWIKTKACCFGVFRDNDLPPSTLTHDQFDRYQTGALRPFVRWLSRVMHRAAAPPRPQRNVVRADNDPPAAARPLNDNAVPEGQGREENEAGNRANANENENVVGLEAGNHWWGIVKEIQMIVFGFITSLFPGFHNHNID